MHKVKLNCIPSYFPNYAMYFISVHKNRIASQNSAFTLLQLWFLHYADKIASFNRLMSKTRKQDL